MTLLFFLGLALVGLAGFLCLRSLMFAHAQRQQALAQIDAYGFDPAFRPVGEARRGLREIVSAFAALVGGRLVHRVGPDRERELRSVLDSAGFFRTSVATFLGYRALATSALFAGPLALAAGGGLSVRGVVGPLFLGGLGWILPRFLLERRAARRVAQIDREVPELVDLLVTTVEAGVGFAAALQLAARSIRGPLGQELRLAFQEQSLGLTTDEALRNLATRVDSPATRTFIQALLQGESLGVSIGKVLRDLAADMRKRRRQSIEESAQKAPTKILFPLVFLILPAMFIVTLGPVVIAIVRVLGSS